MMTRLAAEKSFEGAKPWETERSIAENSSIQQKENSSIQYSREQQYTA